MTRFRVDSEADLQHWLTNGHLRMRIRLGEAAGPPIGQDRGTIVSSNGKRGKFITGDSSLLRSNSIRRSRALERINGNLSNTLSRMLR